MYLNVDMFFCLVEEPLRRSKKFLKYAPLSPRPRYDHARCTGRWGPSYLKHRPARKAKPVMCATLLRACRSSLEAMHHCEFTPVPTSELTPRIFFVFFSLLAFFFIRRNKSDTGGEPIVSCLLYTSPSPRDRQKSRMPSSA